MFENTSEEFRQQLVKELIACETKNALSAKGDEGALTAHFGYVHYSTGEESGILNLEIGFKGPSNSLVKYKDGKISIIINNVDFVEKNFSEIEAMIAHEVGHYLSGHLDNIDSAYLSMYEAESKSAIDNDDQAQHVYWASKSIADGGYIIREMQADTIAAHFVGIDRVFHMQMTDAFNHDNLTVAIEKLNRLKYLDDKFKGIVTPAAGYVMYIETINLNKAEDSSI